MKVALFVPCYVRAVAPQVMDACRKLLQHFGIEAETPPGQTCCGQPMGNAGYEANAEHLKQRFTRIFEHYDTIVAPSSSCVTFVRDRYGDTFKGRIYEFCEFLHDVVKPASLPGEFPHKVSLHNSCHGTRLLSLASPSEQNIPYFNKLRDLLSLKAGVEVVECERPDECCGFGGLFSVEESQISIKMGQDKVRRHLATGAEFITAADSSCLMHQQGIIDRQKLPIRTIHLLEILAAGL
ncbi:MAG: (Fe-S)-binding protein [Bacteroidales bacterium]|nr:(Fe-S)-binding protein [Bacteroidales bacterium]